MPYDKGDFTQQGVNGDVSAVVRLNDKRVVKMVLSSDDESSNVDVQGTVYDYLNGETYPLGGTTPTGTITITENGDYDVSEYRSRSVSVSGGLSFTELEFTDDTISDRYVSVLTIAELYTASQNGMLGFTVTDNNLNKLNFVHNIPHCITVLNYIEGIYMGYVVPMTYNDNLTWEDIIEIVPDDGTGNLVLGYGN